MFKGLFTALITPFKSGKIDFQSLDRVIESQISAGVDGIVICGTTGESPTLSHEEHNALVEHAVKICNKKIKVIAGSGSNSTSETIDLTLHAQSVGSDGVLIITPYYNKPTQEGMFLHYKKVHDATNIPIILYNVPSRTSVNLLDETIVKLSALPRIVGVKDATGDLARLLNLQLLLGNNSDFALFSGDDVTILPFMLCGGHGLISVTSNAFPKECSELIQTKSTVINKKLLPISMALFCETNPMPIKYLMHKLGFCQNELRQPLCQASQECMAKVNAVTA